MYVHPCTSTWLVLERKRKAVGKRAAGKGYECIKILIAIRLSRLKGLKMYNEGVALKRKIVLPLLMTINVCGERERERGTRGGRDKITVSKHLQCQEAKSAFV